MLRDRLQAALPGAKLDQAALDRLVTGAREHGLPVDEALLGDAICASVEQGVALDELEVGDLYFIAACCRGSSAALARFYAIFGGDLDRAIAKSPTLGLAPDEFRQLVVDRLFVRAPDAPPRATKYLGRGPFRA